MELESEPSQAPGHNVFQAPDARLGDATASAYSGLGLASLLLAILAALGIFAAIGYAAYYQISTGSDLSSQKGLMIVVGLAVVGCMLVAVIGLVLGGVGLFQANRKKLLAILGVVFNILVVLLFGVLYAVGLSAT